jgi:ribose transport system substrate-binding protein
MELKMKRVIKLLLLFLIVVFCAGLIGYSYHYNDLQIKLVGSTADKNQKVLHYHFVMITQDIDSDFWQSVKTGIQEAGVEYGAAIEFNGTIVRNQDEEIDYLKIAIASHVDGIAIFVTDDVKFTPLINEAVSKNIPVVTIASDDASSKRIAYIGTNSFDAGTNAGALVVNALSSNANVALILSGNYTGDSDAESKLLSGFKFSLQSYPGIKLQTINTSDTGYFGAEKIIRDILRNHPSVNTIVCTSLDDTLEVAQVLIDLNKVGKITVIGYNINAQIRSYIKNGVIYGSVVENPEETGYQCIKVLVSHIKGNKIQDFIDTGVDTVTRSNLLQYLNNSSLH